MNDVYILGGGRTDFKRNLKKEGKTIRDLITEAGRKSIADAKIDAGEIQAGTVGNFNAGQFTDNCISARFCRRSIRNCVAFPRCTRKRPVRPGALRFARRAMDHGRPL